MPAVNHCSLETHVSIAEYDADGKLTVWTPTQDAFGQRINLQRIFELPMSKIRVISPVMGGGFGGCTINLVKDELYDNFIATAKKRFNEKYGHEPKVYEVVISDGSRRLE